MSTKPSRELETFANPNPARDYTIRMRIPEFTCLCPKTGQPDFATMHLEYVPDETCVELKALKLYMWSFRDEGAFHEAVTNQILEDLVNATQPRFMRLTAEFLVRGGIYTTPHATARKYFDRLRVPVGPRLNRRRYLRLPCGCRLLPWTRLHRSRF